MEKVINNKSFVNLRNDINEVINQFKSIEYDVNQNVYDKYQLNQYEQIIEGNDEDVLQQYETMYDKFAEVILNKNNSIQQSNDSINQVNDMIEYIKKLIDTNNMESIINKEMNNANEMIKCLNQIVDKILEKETTIFNRKEQEFEQQKQQRKQKFEEKQNDIKNMKYNYHNTEEVKRKQQHIEKIKFRNDNELEQINDSIESLLEWSGKQNYNIIFDSKIDGDGCGELKNKVFNKKNLYFISFDNQNNVFGGYVDTIIDKNDWITNPNAFTFSLIRNGKVKNKKYDIKKSYEKYAFKLNYDSDYLYRFGDNGYSDIYMCKIGYNNSYCDYHSYEYNGEQNPLRDNYGGSNRFSMKRILVIQMN